VGAGAGADAMSTTLASTDAVFLSSFTEIWLHLTAWTVGGVGLCFFGAGILACRSVASGNDTSYAGHPTTTGGNNGGSGSSGSSGSSGWKTARRWTCIPLCSLVIGAITGFLQGCIASALVAALYYSIPYDVGIDIAAGLGIGQALVIVYFHLGRADFVHR